MACWDRFDRIVCVHYAPHIERKRTLIKELERVGILPDSIGRFQWHTTSSSRVNEAIWQAVRDSGVAVPKTVGQFNASLNHYEVIRSAFAEGCRELLIIENDIRFLKDVKSVERIVADWNPKIHGDLCLFDRFIWNSRCSDAVKSGNYDFIPFDTAIRGGSCYALSRKAMEMAITAFENLFLIRKVQMIGDCLYDAMSCSKCFSRRCICVQKEFAGNLNSTACHTSQYDVYRKDGVDLSLYNL